MNFKYVILTTLFLGLCVSIVSAGLEQSVVITENTIISKDDTTVMFESGNVTATKGVLSVSTAATIDGKDYAPEISEVKGDTLVWDDSVVKMEYQYNGQSVKESITIKEDREIEFKLVINENSKLIPWYNGQWKLVNKYNGDTMNGLVLERPFGIDASGRYIGMDYEYKESVLKLVYNRTQTTYKLDGTKLVPEYHQIQYPLVIDPTWTSASGCWTATVDGWNVVKWNTTGNSTWVVPTGVTSAWVFVVAGGGAGGGGVGADGNNWGGGGGGGAVLNGTMSLTPGNEIIVKVGAGGANGTNGGFSVFNTAVAPGGGAGKGTTDGSARAGLEGGSGGGGSAFGGGAAGATNATTSGGLTAHGYIGGAGFNDGDPAPYGGSGGGGGAGGAGMNGASGVTGNGGLCLASNITGTLTNYSAGGGGNTYTLKGIGGCPDTGGNSSADTASPDTQNGVDGTGSGGGGAGTWGGNSQSKGGSGIVVIRYLVQTTANFSYTPVSGLFPLDVTFNDTSTGTVSTWNWSFGDGTYASTQNTTHTYYSGGNYTVILNATGSTGTNLSQKYVTVWNTTSTNFTATNLTGGVPLVVRFTDESSNATSWYWELDTGITSTLQNPVYTFAVTGLYTINHSSSNTWNTTWFNRSNYINATAATPTPTPTPTPSTTVTPVVTILPGNVTQKLTIHAQRGENYIRWYWSPINVTNGTPPVDVYLDENTTPVVRDFLGTSYIVYGLDPKTPHYIMLLNGSESNESISGSVIGKATASTIRPQFEVYFLVAIALVLMLFCIFITDLTRLILLTLLSILVSLFSFFTSDGYGATSYIFIVTMIVTGAMFLINGIPRIREQIDWW